MTSHCIIYVPSAHDDCTHAFKQGKLLAEAAIALMNEEKVGRQQDVLALQLIVRKSCGAGPLTPTRSKTRLANASSDRKPREASASKGKHPGVEL